MKRAPLAPRLHAILVFAFLYLPIAVLSRLFLQWRKRGRLSAARLDAALVSHAAR